MSANRPRRNAQEILSENRGQATVLTVARRGEARDSRVSHGLGSSNVQLID